MAWITTTKTNIVIIIQFWRILIKFFVYVKLLECWVFVKSFVIQLILLLSVFLTPLTLRAIASSLSFELLWSSTSITVVFRATSLSLGMSSGSSWKWILWIKIFPIRSSNLSGFNFSTSSMAMTLCLHFCFGRHYYTFLTISLFEHASNYWWSL